MWRILSSSGFLVLWKWRWLKRHKIPRAIHPQHDWPYYSEAPPQTAEKVRRVTSMRRKLTVVALLEVHKTDNVNRVSYGDVSSTKAFVTFHTCETGNNCSFWYLLLVAVLGRYTYAKLGWLNLSKDEKYTILTCERHFIFGDRCWWTSTGSGYEANFRERHLWPIKCLEGRNSWTLHQPGVKILEQDALRVHCFVEHADESFQLLFPLCL